MDYLQVTTTVASRNDADQLAHALLEVRLAACCQIVGPIYSSYWWKGRIENTEEWMCVVKTTTVRFDEVRRRISALHTYDNPEITAVPITDGSPAYLGWISGETTT